MSSRLFRWTGEERAEHSETIADTVGAALCVDVGRWVFGKVKDLKGRFGSSPEGVGVEFGGELLRAAWIGDEGDGDFCVFALR